MKLKDRIECLEKIAADPAPEKKIQVGKNVPAIFVQDVNDGLKKREGEFHTATTNSTGLASSALADREEAQKKREGTIATGANARWVYGTAAATGATALGLTGKAIRARRQGAPARASAVGAGGAAAGSLALLGLGLWLDRQIDKDRQAAEALETSASTKTRQSEIAAEKARNIQKEIDQRRAFLEGVVNPPGEDKPAPAPAPTPTPPPPTPTPPTPNTPPTKRSGGSRRDSRYTTKGRW